MLVYLLFIYLHTILGIKAEYHMPTSTLPQSHNPSWSESQVLEAFITAQPEEAVYSTNLPMKTAKGWEKKSL